MQPSFVGRGNGFCREGKVARGRRGQCLESVTGPGLLGTGPLCQGTRLVLGSLEGGSLGARIHKGGEAGREGRGERRPSS